MRHVAHVAGTAALLFVAACSSAPRSEPAGTSSAPLTQGDQSDTSCQVVLRRTNINFESALGPQTDCSSGTCWVVITVTFDVAMSQSLDQAQAYVLYQGGGQTDAGATWQQSAPAQPIFGAPEGYRRYQVVLSQNTFTSGPGNTDVALIPFLSEYWGERLFDHNRVADPLGAYQLTANDNWTISDDGSVCAGAAPASTLTATFATGWSNSSTGSLAANGKLDVSYDVYRLPQTLGCTTDGVDAFATNAYVRFQPSGTVLTELVSGPFNQTTGKYESLPLEFDVPGGTTSASLWFMSSSDCNGGPYWDSNYGANYTFTAQ
jgi:hypothetical protein